MAARKVQRLCAAFHTQAAEQTPQVHFDRVLADVEFGRNVAVAQTTVEHDDELLLALGEFGVA